MARLPLVFYIHGGGWVRGDKSEVRVEKYLAAGISVVSINYRFSWQAQIAGAKPPVEWPMHDAARALQFVRSKAVEWNIDKRRIGVSGQSAGGCTALWLAMHDDLAEVNSSDLIARESTRAACAAVFIAQTSLDPAQMEAWSPHSVYGGHAFGFMDPKDLNSRDRHFSEFLAHRADVLSWIKEYSPFEHASTSSPPTFLLYDSAPNVGGHVKSPTHTSNFGVKLQERLQQLGVECVLVYPGSTPGGPATMDEFLIGHLKQTALGASR